ncbi:MAG: hypothetical protein LBR91_03545 [Puniceicoccales bacterium]|jgi:hypothetical protein|nr:hypothetical protein [Puniceicoccales bacterium]
MSIEGNGVNILKSVENGSTASSQNATTVGVVTNTEDPVNIQDQLVQNVVLNPRAVVNTASNSSSVRGLGSTYGAQAIYECFEQLTQVDKEYGNKNIALEDAREQVKGILASFNERLENLSSDDLRSMSDLTHVIGEIIEIAIMFDFEIPKSLAEKGCDLFIENQKVLKRDEMYCGIMLLLCSDGPIDKDKALSFLRAAFNTSEYKALEYVIEALSYALGSPGCRERANVDSFVSFLGEVGAKTFSDLFLNPRISPAFNPAFNFPDKIAGVATAFGIKIPKLLVEKIYDMFMGGQRYSMNASRSTRSYVTLFLCSDAAIDAEKILGVLRGLDVGIGIHRSANPSDIHEVINSVPLHEHVIANIPFLVDCLMDVDATEWRWNAIAIDVACSAFERFVKGQFPLHTLDALKNCIANICRKAPTSSYGTTAGIFLIYVMMRKYVCFELTEACRGKAQSVLSDILLNFLADSDTCARILNNGLNAGSNTRDGREAIHLVEILEGLSIKNNDVGKIVLRLNGGLRNDLIHICTFDAIPVMTHFVNIVTKVLELNGGDPKGQARKRIAGFVYEIFINFVPHLDDTSKAKLLPVIVEICRYDFVRDHLVGNRYFIINGAADRNLRDALRSALFPSEEQKLPKKQ